MLNYLGLPAAASSHAADIDQMTVLVHWLMLVLFVGWGAFFLFVLVRFRRGANPKANYAGAKGKFAKSTEIAVAIVEVALLLFYAIPRGRRASGSSRRKTKRRWCGSSASSSRGTCTTRARTASSAAPTSSW